YRLTVQLQDDVAALETGLRSGRVREHFVQNDAGVLRQVELLAERGVKRQDHGAEPGFVGAGFGGVRAPGPAGAGATEDAPVAPGAADDDDGPAEGDLRLNVGQRHRRDSRLDDRRYDRIRRHDRRRNRIRGGNSAGQHSTDE